MSWVEAFEHILHEIRIVCQCQIQSVVYVDRQRHDERFEQKDDKWKGCMTIRNSDHRWSRNQNDNRLDKLDHSRRSYSSRMGAIVNCYKEKGDTFEREGGREGGRER